MALKESSKYFFSILWRLLVLIDDTRKIETARDVALGLSLQPGAVASPVWNMVQAASVRCEVSAMSSTTSSKSLYMVSFTSLVVERRQGTKNIVIFVMLAAYPTKKKEPFWIETL